MPAGLTIFILSRHVSTRHTATFRGAAPHITTHRPFGPQQIFRASPHTATRHCATPLYSTQRNEPFSLRLATRLCTPQHPASSRVAAPHNARTFDHVHC